MKKEIRYDFEGAEGDCNICGTKVTLERGDKILPVTLTRNKIDHNLGFIGATRIWKVICPGCKNELECEKDVEKE